MSLSISRRRFLAASAAGAANAWAKGTGPKVACQANGFVLKQGDFPGLLGALEQMKRLGYTGFECNVRFVRDQFDTASQARKQIESAGVQFIGAHMSVEQTKPETFPAIVKGVAGLGAQAIVMSARGLSPEGQFEKSALEKKAAQLESLAQVCKGGGLRLAYHNHNPEFANHNAEIEGLAAATSPALVWFLMDAGHGYLGGGDPAEFMAHHSDRIFGCHVKTFQGGSQDRQVPLGQGDFGFEALSAAIKKTSWTGWLIDEEGGGPKPGNTAALGRDREYIRKIFGV
ncbi:MAG: sugar phosphate isomerase/epimerase family protein [Bryobacteraceae bacterium]